MLDERLAGLEEAFSTDYFNHEDVISKIPEQSKWFEIDCGCSSRRTQFATDNLLINAMSRGIYV